MKIYRCEKCGKEAKTQKGLSVHYSMHNREERRAENEKNLVPEEIKCEKCGKETNSEWGLRIHNARMHKESSRQPSLEKGVKDTTKLADEIIRILEMPLLDDEYRLALIEYVVRR